MIKSLLSRLTLAGLLLPGHLLAVQCTSTASGSWGNAATWSCGHVPTGGDTLTILAGHTVSVTQNYVYNGAPLRIKIYGIWYFSGGGSKVSLPCGSVIEIMPGGQLMPNSNSGGHSETVKICGVTYWYFDQGAQGGYQIWPNNTPLPIELISFDAAVTGSSVMLHWATATERASDHYELFVGADPIAFEPLTKVAAQGNTTTTTDYAYVDVGRKPGIWYYNLKEIDADGTVSDQGTVAVLVKDMGNDITCTPTSVADGHLLVSMDDLEQGVLQITSADGRIHSMADPVMSDRDMAMLNVAHLKSGVYYASVVSNTGRNTCTFVIE